MDRLVAPLSAAERTAFIAAARAFLTAGPDGGPVRFQHRGRSVRGVDCVGLVALAMKQVGREINDRRVYGREPEKDGLWDVLVEHFGPPIWRKGDALDALQPGDVPLMQWHRMPNHVGIVTDYPTGGNALIHSLAPTKCVVEHRLSDPWPRRLVAGWRP